MDRIKCLECSEQAAIIAHNRTKPYCTEHFVQYFEKKVFQTIREYKMIRKGEHVAVGLSGGKDSSVTLYLLKKLQERLPFKLSAIILDEGIKGYRDEAYKKAKELCKKLKIKLYYFSFLKEYKITIDNVSKVSKKFGPCSYCGVLRRELLDKAAKKIKADKIATGHNLDDIAQTIILNVIRNEPKRLLRISPNSELGIQSNKEKKFIVRIWPLAKMPEIEVATYALIKNLSMHFQDCPYAFEAMRQKVREMLNLLEDSYPGTKVRIFKFLENLKLILELEDKKTEIKKCKKCGRPAALDLCAKCKLLSYL
ncbi:MAG: TIGR00269 family protein [Candidatus Micrarchaeota archaeon]|nr:TIGR00269 family protein [Candidatus Micrarchaeota archaeon]